MEIDCRPEIPEGKKPEKPTYLKQQGVQVSVYMIPHPKILVNSYYQFNKKWFRGYVVRADKIDVLIDLLRQAQEIIAENQAEE